MSADIVLGSVILCWIANAIRRESTKHRKKKKKRTFVVVEVSILCSLHAKEKLRFNVPGIVRTRTRHILK